MELSTHILLTYGYALLFGWVLIEQLGAPLPAAPVLMAAGALSAEREMSFWLALATGVVAALIADTAWFWIGRRYGHMVLRLLCRMSLEPTSCVRRTELSCGHRGSLMLLFAKFVPGLATLAPPVAGQNGVRLGSFLLYDGAGSALWAGALLLGGRFCGAMLHSNEHVLDWVGKFSGGLLLLGIVGFFFVRLVRRQNALRLLRRSRLEPEELKRQLDAGEPVYIVDLREAAELRMGTLPGALALAPRELTERLGEIPRDRDVVLLCDCPSEATAAQTAMRLHKLGIDRVRPLRGGAREWRRLGYPLEGAFEPELVHIEADFATGAPEAI